MESIERSETVEIDADRWVLLEFGRRWPKYVVAWSVRQRVGDSDFPLASGSVDQMPSGDAGAIDEMWARLRESALDQAMSAAAGTAEQQGSESKPRSFLDRLLGR